MGLHVNEFRGEQIVAAYTTLHLDAGLTPAGRHGNAVLFSAPCGAHVVVSMPQSSGDIVAELTRQGWEGIAELPAVNMERYFS